MFNLSNVLSLLRLPLAFLFFIPQTQVRVAAILGAMLTDCFDGYVARKYQHTTRLGAVLDPLMDKFFVFAVALILLSEGVLGEKQFASLLSRDIAIALFTLYLFIINRWKKYPLRSLITGKISTALQFFVLLLLVLNVPMSNAFSTIFVILGVCVLGELFLTLKSNIEKA